MLPIFQEATYTVDNVVPLGMQEHFEVTADLHRQIADLPDGAQVRIEIVD